MLTNAGQSTKYELASIETVQDLVGLDGLDSWEILCEVANPCCTPFLPSPEYHPPPAPKMPWLSGLCWGANFSDAPPRGSIRSSNDMCIELNSWNKSQHKQNENGEVRPHNVNPPQDVSAI